MNFMNPRERMHDRILIVVALFVSLPTFPFVANGQDIQAVRARLEAKGAKIRSASEEGTADRFASMAKWHEVKERIITGAIAGDEITEEQANTLRIEIVKQELLQLAAESGPPTEISNHPESGKAVTAETVVRRMDTNDDGKISKSEAPEDLKLYFGDYDLNGDGAIDVKEARTLVKYMSPSQAEQKQSRASQPEKGFGRVSAMQIVQGMDKNRDQKISRDEASEDLKPYFDQMDVNRDGLIDVKEAQPVADYVNQQSDN